MKVTWKYLNRMRMVKSHYVRLTAYRVSIFCIAAALFVRFSSRQDKGAPKYYCNGKCGVYREMCSCKWTCKTLKNCCFDYNESCGGGKSWIDEKCVTRGEMTCPNGYERTILMVSIDGFHDSYLERGMTPYISKLARCGVVSQMTPQYPTKTLPNHYTMATGLYPESHGIIGNMMYDHDNKDEFLVNKPSAFDPKWWKGEPIWVTASKAGMKTAAYFWPGSDVNITRYPEYWMKYNGSVPAEERVHTVLNWLKMDARNRPRLIVMYYIVVDSAGHLTGPIGSTVDNSLIQADKMVGMIMEGLYNLGLHNCIDVAVVSDHGMADVNCAAENIKYLEDYGVNVSELYLDVGTYVRIGKSPQKSLGRTFNTSEIKKKLECKQEETHWEVFLKNEYLPKRYHYANHPCIENIHLLVDMGWWATGSPTIGRDCNLGDHGYDNLYDEMMALFVGHGPSFKLGYNRSQPFDNVELYNLCADILKVPKAANNGTNGALYDVMYSPPKRTTERETFRASLCEFSEFPAASRNSEMAEANLQMPFGTLSLLNPADDCCTVIGTNHLSIYDRSLQMPRVIFTSLLSTQDVEHSTGSPEEETADETMSNVTDHGIIYPDLLVTDNRAGKRDDDVSRRVPVYHAFHKIWVYMQQEIRKWAKSYNGIAIHVGPIFDYNYDGHVDDSNVLQRSASYSAPLIGTPMPTHFYLIMARCRNPSVHSRVSECMNDVDNIEVLNFVIPNYKELPCHKATEKRKEWIPRSLLRHVARIRDIELLTNISFLQKWIASESDDIHFAAVRAKLYLPRESSSSWLSDFVKSSRTILAESNQRRFSMLQFFIVVITTGVTVLAIIFKLYKLDEWN